MTRPSIYFAKMLLMAIDGYAGQARLGRALMWRYGASLNAYSITAWSGACACLRKAALLEPIISASGIAHSVNSITIW